MNFTNHWEYYYYRVIRLSSPNLNYIIIGGAILIYCSGIASALPTTNPEIRLFLCFVSAMLLYYNSWIINDIIFSMKV